MRSKPTKAYRLNYEVTDKKIRNAIVKVIASGQDPTVKLVAEMTGISISTAYAHNCQDMILEALLEK